MNTRKAIRLRWNEITHVDTLKWLCLLLIGWTPNFANCQTLESLHVNLYTDSLKRGTWNYINIDGYFSNKRYLPLDTQWLEYHSNIGHFDGNKLWLPDTVDARDVHIQVRTRKEPTLEQSFVVAIKQLPDPPLMIREEEILFNPPTRKRRRG